MPELPDVEVYKKYLDATSLHQEIEDVEITAAKMLEGGGKDKYAGRLKGQVFTKTHRQGKTLFVRCGDESWLVLHFGMTGYLDYAGDNNEPPKHTRMVIFFEGGNRLAFVSQRMLGKIGWTEDPGKYAEEQGLGPDALSEHWNMDNFEQLFEGSKTDVKKVLMDQKHISGIGNVYTDEILFHAGLRPDRKASELEREEISALHRSMLHVLKTATEREANPEKVPGSWLLPRRESGADCPGCKGKVKKTKIGGRGCYYCPDCQR
jgi:formamidopyrimidine-DNA glycosylase